MDMEIGKVGTVFLPKQLNKPKYIKRSAIDDAKWNDLVSNAVASIAFAYTWYLDELCDWDALILGDYEAVMPLPNKSKYGLKYVYQPRFIQQLGVFSKEQNLDYTRLFFQAIPRKFVLAEFFVNSHFGLYKSAKPRRNLILHLDRPYDELLSNFAKDAKKSIRKSEDVVFKEGTTISESIELYKEIYGKLNPEITNWNYGQLLKACEAANKNGKLIHTTFWEGEVLLGMGLLLCSGNRLHNFCAAPTEVGRQKDVMHAYINYIIKTHAESKWVLDFEGSQIENVAYFFNKFNPVEEPYLHIKRYPVLG